MICTETAATPHSPSALLVQFISALDNFTPNRKKTSGRRISSRIMVAAKRPGVTRNREGQNQPSTTR